MSEVDFQIGQVVEAKGRQWYIAEKRNIKAENGKETQVYRLKSIAGVKAEWYVIPEIEALTNPIKKSSLPPPEPMIGFPFAQQLLTQAYRYTLRNDSLALTCLRNARVIPENYQLVPVLMGLKQQDRIRLLIADGVGLGKTVESLLILSELYNKEKINRILIACPANIREQWRSSLKRFFNLDAVIVDSQSRRKLESQMMVDQNVWNYYNIVIVSTDYLKQIYILGEVIQYPWDMAIIDEAHNVCMPHNYFRKKEIFQKGQLDLKNQKVRDRALKMMERRYQKLNEKLQEKNTSSLTRKQIEKQFRRKQEKEAYEMALIIANKMNHLILLTATPHNGFTDSFASLLHLLDEKCLSSTLNQNDVDIKINREYAKHHVCQRSIDLIKDNLVNSNVFPIENENTEEIETNSAYIALKDDIKDYCAMLIKFFKILKLDSDKQLHNMSIILRWVIQNLNKRLISSPYALYASLNTIIRTKEKEIEEREKKEEKRAFADLSDYEMEYSEEEIAMNMFDMDTLSDKNEDQVEEDLSKKIIKIPLEAEKFSLTFLKTLKSNTDSYMGKFGSLIEDLINEMNTKVIIEEDKDLSYLDRLNNAFKRSKITLGTKIQKNNFLEKYNDRVKDNKLKRIIELIPNIAEKANKQELGCDKFIIFTRYTDTLHYLEFHLNLQKLLEKSYFKDLNIFVIHGKHPFYLREKIYNEFRKADRGILISTDCMAEGIDLQYSANILINYELTWNPNRIAQRNGRISRFYQPKKYVYLYLLILKHSYEDKILLKIKEKLNSMKIDVGTIPAFFKNTIDLKSSSIATLPELPKNQIDIKQYFKDAKTTSDLLDKEESEIIDQYYDQILTGDIDRRMQDENTLHNIVNDSFFRQEDVKIEDVQEKMHQFQSQYGSSAELLLFLKTGLEKYGIKLEKAHPEKEIFKVSSGVNPDPYQQLLEEMGVSANQDILITTDPVIGVRNEDIEELKLNSPILTTLIDKIKRDCFVDNPDFYGRIVCRGIPETLAKSHVVECNILFRFAVHMENPIVFEELHPIAMQLRPPQILFGKDISQFYEFGKMNSSISDGEKAMKFIRMAIESDIFKEAVSKFHDLRIEALIKERTHFWDSLATNQIQSISKEKFLDVRAPSWDILTITLHTREIQS